MIRYAEASGGDGYMNDLINWSPCLKAEKRRGEEILQGLKKLKLLRRGAKIDSDERFIYLPLVRVMTAAELTEIGDVELLTRKIVVLKPRKSIEEILGFKSAYSYEIIGDIAVLRGANRDREKEAEAESELTAVAHALMETHKKIKVVARETSRVEGEFRRRTMAVIAGTERTETLHRENRCRYKLDLEKVYFNPRLAGERNRVALQAARSGVDEEIVDMFAGVGSFAIQVAKRNPQSHVTAIEINPDAIRYLCENMRENRLQNIVVVEGDVRDLYLRFIGTADRLIMNLPKSAYLFMREALSMLNPEGGIVHFYDIESSYSDADADADADVPPQQFSREDWDKEKKKKKKKKSPERAVRLAKEKLMATVQELSEEYNFHSTEILDARRVIAYAPYTYIIGIDAEIRP